MRTHERNYIKGKENVWNKQLLLLAVFLWNSQWPDITR